MPLRPRAWPGFDSAPPPRAHPVRGGLHGNGATHRERLYVHLGVGPEVQLVDVTPDFWTTLDTRPDLLTGRLVTALWASACEENPVLSER